MLTSGQCLIAAYMTDGGIICPDCAEKRIPVSAEQIQEGARWALEIEKGRDIYGHEKWDISDWTRKTHEALEENLGLEAIIQYTLDSEFSDENGCYCDICGCELVEPYVEDNPEDVPCIKCGRTDLPLHTNGRCGECGIAE